MHEWPLGVEHRLWYAEALLEEASMDIDIDIRHRDFLSTSYSGS